MASDRFRQQLREEAEQWREEGLITAEQYRQFADRYQFATLDRITRDRFIVILLSLGSFLLGVGLITFVAANWQAIPREVKMALLMTLFVGVNAIGFYLWKHPVEMSESAERWQQRLGQGLLLLGAMILGANMALMGQLFHSSGSPSQLCLIWSLGILAMAYSLRLTLLGILAIVVMGIGFWLGIQQLYSTGLVELRSMLQYMPLLSGVLFLPLAYWCRSNVIFVLTAIAVVSSLVVIVMDLGQLTPDAPGLVAAIAFSLPIALLWSYDDAFWFRLFRRSPPAKLSFPSFSQALALIGLTLLSYALSFHWSWEEPDSVPAFANQVNIWWNAGFPFLLNGNVLILLAVTLVGWFRLLRSRRRWQINRTDGVILTFILLIALIPFWHWSVEPIQAIATFLFNVILFLLAVGFLREGLGQGQRPLFWSGMILLTLQILSRTTEYDTGLLFKSFVFLLCGIGIIVIGLWFERYVRTLASPEDS